MNLPVFFGLLVLFLISWGAWAAWEFLTAVYNDKENDDENK